MNKKDISKIFETDIANLESSKKEQILKRAVQIVQDERGLLIELMIDWIEGSNPSKTELAVLVAQELGLIELIPTLEILQEKITQQNTSTLEIRIVDKTVNILRTIRMSKDDISAMFETDFTNPAAEKEGNYLGELILRRARIIVERARGSLVEVMKDWIREGSSSPTRFAISVAEELKLTELIPVLQTLREEIIQNKAPGMTQWEIRYVDEAIKILQES